MELWIEADPSLDLRHKRQNDHIGCLSACSMHTGTVNVLSACCSYLPGVLFGLELDPS